MDLSDDDEDDDDDSDEEYQPYHQRSETQNRPDCIRDIENKLIKNNLRYTKKELQPSSSDDYKYMNVDEFKDLFAMFTSTGKYKDKNTNTLNSDYPHKKRLMIMVASDTMYCYEPPKNCRDLEGFPEWGLIANQTSVLPNETYTQSIDEPPEKKRVLTMGNVHTKNMPNDLLTLSFQVIRANEIRCYLFWNGSMIRFMPKDLRTIAIKMFNMDWNKGENRKFINESQDLKKIIKSMEGVIRDDLFTSFCDFCNLGKK